MRPKRYPTPKIPTCPDCGIHMEPGMIPDANNAIYATRSAWVPGFADESMLSGLKLTGKLVFPITSFRCGQCGLLRAYAFRPTQRHG